MGHSNRTGNRTHRHERILCVSAVAVLALASWGACDRVDSDWGNAPVTDQPPTTPSNPTPADGADNVPRDPDLSWNRSSDPDGDDANICYDVFFSDAADGLERIGQGLSDASREYDADTLLHFSSTYYWRVVAFDESGKTSSSSIWSFTTVSNQPPDAPELQTPADGSVDVLIDVPLVWICSTDPEGDPVVYDVYIDIDYSDWQPVRTDYLSCSYKPPEDLELDTTYFWQVVARDTAGNESVSERWSFTTIANQPPSPPELKQPTDGSTKVSERPSLVWGPSSDPDGDPIEYTVYLGESINLTIPADGMYTCGSSNCTFTLDSDLELSTQYFWKVVARDSFGNTAESQVWSFTTDWH